MSYVRVAGSPVLSARVDLGLRGVWVADLEVDIDEAPAVGELVRIEWGSTDFRGTVRTSGAFEGRARLFVVGGAGGLGQALRAQHYADTVYGITVAQLVDDVMTDAGEALSPTVDRTALEALVVQTWERVEGIAGTALGRIATLHGLGWRVLADGTVWVGREAWEPFAGRALTMSTDEAHGRAVLADADDLVPGDVYEGRRVYRVVHILEGDRPRAEVTYERSAGADAEAFVRAMLPELPYLKSYEARVVGQNGDGTLELIAYDPAIGGLSRVPIRLGLPGCAVTVAAGARVDVGFEEGDPRKAYAGLWNTSAAMVNFNISGSGDSEVRFASLRVYGQPGGTCQIDGFDGVAVLGGSRKVARVDDSVLWATALWDAATTTLYLSLGDLPAPLYLVTLVGLGSVTGILPNPNSPIAPSPGTPGTPLTGKITSGKDGFTA
jgi:hypothetical protein